MDLISIDDINAARKAIAGRVLKTPAIRSAGLTALLGRPVVLKPELLQQSGCFKPRGIFNKIQSLTKDELDKGIVTVSGGNHGIAIAQIAGALGLKAVVVMPQTAPQKSQERVRAAGATLLLAADVSVAFEMANREKQSGLTYIHSYDDPMILAGHGTAGLEMIEDAPDLTDVFVSIGGGALISGVATAMRAVKPGIRIWGVETVGADCMTQARAAGQPVSIKVTSISTTLGAPTATERTLAHVNALVEDVVVIPDAEAVKGLLSIAEEAKFWVEPAAGCLLPAAQRLLSQLGKEAVIGLVLCGGNVGFDDIARWRSQFSV